MHGKTDFTKLYLCSPKCPCVHVQNTYSMPTEEERERDGIKCKSKIQEVMDREQLHLSCVCVWYRVEGFQGFPPQCSIAVGSKPS